MNTKNLFFVLLSISLAGCELGQEIELAAEKPVALDEVKAVLDGELFTPPGKLKSIYYYEFEIERLNHRQDWYYNEHGQEIFTVGIRSANDTSRVTLHGYNALGNQISERSFEIVDNRYKWFSTKLYFYDDSGKLSQRFDQNPFDKRLVATYHYNDKGLLELVQFDSQRYLYDYDDENRVIRFRWVGPIGDDYAIHDYYYRYDNQNRLESKVTGTGIAPGEPMKEVFEYFYNEKGQLVEEREYYPEMGYPLRYKKVYEYYLDGEVNRN